MKQLKPLNNNVIIRPRDEEEQIHGNIIVPDIGKNKHKIGEVIATGPGIYTITGTLIPVGVEVGDIIAYTDFQGIQFSDGEGDLICIKDNDIITKIIDLPTTSSQDN